eukprot:gene22663-biopygen22998
MNSISLCFVCWSVSIVNGPILCLLTSSNAASGHGKNQLMLQPVTKLGNFLARVRNLSPTGDMHSTKCKFERTLFTKYRQSQSPVSWKSFPASFFAITRMSPMTLSFSSLVYNPGTSPELRKPLMYSRNCSDLISESVKMKQTGPRVPAYVYCSRTSSKRALMPYDFEMVIWNVL